jgi:hypothetical protein
MDKINQAEIIKDVATIQINSINRALLGVFDEPSIMVEYEEAFATIGGLTSTEFVQTLTEMKKKFETIKEEPHRLEELDKIQMALFIHVLFNCEDNWKYKYPVALKCIYRKAWAIQDFIIKPNNLN